MNSIGWVVGHLSWQEHAFFVAGLRCSDVVSEYRAFVTDSPASIPRLGEVMVLWHAAREAPNVWLSAANEASVR